MLNQLPSQFIEELSNKFANKNTIPSPTEMLVALGELKVKIDDIEMTNRGMEKELDLLNVENEELHIKCGNKPISKCCKVECKKHPEFDFYYCPECLEKVEEGIDPVPCEYEWKELTDFNRNF